MPRRLYARITWEEIFRHSVPRLVEALHYKVRMEQAGVPTKIINKILRRWNPWNYALRKEMEGVIRDLRSSR